MILGAPNASWERRFTSKMILASDFEALEVSGAPRGDQESAKTLPKRFQEEEEEEEEEGEGEGEYEEEEEEEEEEE